MLRSFRDLGHHRWEDNIKVETSTGLREKSKAEGLFSKKVTAIIASRELSHTPWEFSTFPANSI